MKKRIVLLCIACFIISVCSGLTKNKLCTAEFIKAFPSFATSVASLIISSFMARKYEVPNRFLSFIVFMLIVYGMLLWYCIKNMEVLTISLFAPCKLIFTCSLIKMFGTLQLKKIQYFSLVLITIGLLFPIIWSLKSKNEIKMPVSHGLICLICGMIFAIANYSYELYQKKYKPYLWDLIFSGSITALPISTFLFIFELVNSQQSFKMFLKQKNLLVICLATYTELGSKVIVLLMVNTIFRSIIMLLQSVSIGLVDSLLFEFKKFQMINLISFIIANLGLLLYDYKVVQNLLFKKEKNKDNKESEILKSQTFPKERAPC